MSDVAITRTEQYLNGIAEGKSVDIEPVTRKELFLAKAAGMDVETPDPVTREEMYLSKISGGSSGGVPINNQDKTITQNGAYTADEGYTGLGTVSVNVARDDQVDVEEQRDALIARSISGDFVSNADTIGVSALSECKSLTNARFPLATKIASQAFRSCTNLVTLDLPNVVHGIGTQGATQAFYYCEKLTKINVPRLTTVYDGMFGSCKKLEKIDLPSVGKIERSGCSSSYLLKTVVLRKENVVGLNNTSAFNDCYYIQGTKNSTHNPEGLKTGYFYVPRALVEEYKAATNWSNFATQFRALEDYTVDGTITGELDESKI